MITHVYLVRHGATPSTAAHLFAGASNPPLSDEGRAQVEKLSARLSSVDLAAAFCSDKDRTVQTATILCQPHPSFKLGAIKLIPTPALREINHGRWEGQTREFVLANFGDEYARWESDPYNFAPEGGENGKSVLARALPALQKIVMDHAGKSVLVVSHTGTNRLLLCGLLGVDPSRYRDRFAQDLACLNVLEIDGDGANWGANWGANLGANFGAKLCLMNDTSHYAKTASVN